MKKVFTVEDNNFMKSQIKNTKKIIQTFMNDNELSYTALQNGLLSLVVLPYESVKRKDKQRILKGHYSDFKYQIGFNEIIFSPINKVENKKFVIGNKSQYSFLKKFRNAIAHQNINISVDENGFQSIEFFNLFPMFNHNEINEEEYNEYNLVKHNNDVIDFKVSFTKEQLRNLALYIADSFMNSI